MWKGGLCAAVATSVPCRQLHSWTGDGGDLLMLDFERFRTVSAWRRPGTSRDDFDEEICHIFGEAASAHRVCLAFGDFNDEPLESPLLDLGVEISAPKDGDTYLPSRWGGSRAIDWIGFNDPTLAVHSQFSEVKLGDRRLLQTTWQATFERRPEPSFDPPLCVTSLTVPVSRSGARSFGVSSSSARSTRATSTSSGFSWWT